MINHMALSDFVYHLVRNSAETGDAIGVFMLGVPASSLLGADKEGDIAVSKGKVNAMELAIKQKNC